MNHGTTEKTPATTLSAADVERIKARLFKDLLRIRYPMAPDDELPEMERLLRKSRLGRA